MFAYDDSGSDIMAEAGVSPAKAAWGAVGRDAMEMFCGLVESGSGRGLERGGGFEPGWSCPFKDL